MAMSCPVHGKANGATFASGASPSVASERRRVPPSPHALAGGAATANLICGLFSALSAQAVHGKPPFELFRMHWDHEPNFVVRRNRSYADNSPSPSPSSVAPRSPVNSDWRKVTFPVEASAGGILRRVDGRGPG